MNLRSASESPSTSIPFRAQVFAQKFVVGCDVRDLHGLKLADHNGRRPCLPKLIP